VSYTPAAMAVRCGTQTPLAVSQRIPSAPGIASAYQETVCEMSGLRGSARVSWIRNVCPQTPTLYVVAASSPLRSRGTIQ